MAKLREDKKREILEFLEENAENDESLVVLEVEQVVEKFTDETFDREVIENIVDELEEDGLVQEKTAKLDVVYPVKYENLIEDRFDHLFESSPVFASYFIGTLVSIFLLGDSGPAFQYIFGDAVGEPTTIAVRGVLFGVLGAYGIGRIVIRGGDLAQENIEILQEQKRLIAPIVALGAVTGTVAITFTAYTSQSLTTNNLIQIISVSVVGGVAIGKLLKEKE